MAPETLAAPDARDTLHGGERRNAALPALAILVLGLSAAYLTTGVVGNWGFVLQRRAVALATLILVAAAIAIATVLFQTVTTNRILTPSIMGFDALYLLIQTLTVFGIGVIGVHRLDPTARFAAEATAMVTLALVLYRWLLVDLRRSLHLLVLAGVVIGGLFRSVSSLVQRLLDPTQFIVLQDRFFARFDSTRPELLLIAALLVAAAVAIAWRQRRVLDVLALGREHATNLGIDHRRTVLTVLALVALLVAVATALVGPTGFFGLLAAHLAYRATGSSSHRVTLPAAALVAAACLIGGQVVLERLLGFEGSLSLVVEFLGGIIFIILLLRRAHA